MIFYIIRGMYLVLLNSVDFIFGNIIEVGHQKIANNFGVKNFYHGEAPFWFDLVLFYGGQAIFFYIIWKLYQIGFTPLDRVQDLTDVGWGDGSKRAAANRIREIQRIRKSNELPPVYPNGWFAVAESRNIPKKQVISVSCLGETFAVFRGDDGKINILDAFCPHMGANMAVGGVVKGNCLECPFHGWLFDGKNGVCSHIPYAKKVPDFAKVRRWPSDERNGMVFVWYDAEGRPPQWTVPAIKEIENGEYPYRGRTEHKILAHIQEIPENGSDLAHLGHLHTPNIMKGTDLAVALTANKLLDFIHHEWDGVWKPLEAPNEHRAEVTLSHSIPMFGFKPKMMDVHVRAEQVERDIMIWNNKIFPTKPMFVAEDKLIPRFRRWYSQFYSKNSPRFGGFRKEGLDW
ncbi:Cholesterol 7-desaturase [Armadillidium nasatum]|uniref:cholesterol 7-desaturase n=1 Tax=Armadillidium nasatum TaxID=96803 RepID=A0A5N5TI28_9CRUS|nr:Cholesterol 7-desaturase [Armadillidium nasatum]